MNKDILFTKQEKKSRFEYIIRHLNKVNPIIFKEKFDFFYNSSLQILDGDLLSNKEKLIDYIIELSKQSMKEKDKSDVTMINSNKSEKEIRNKRVEYKTIDNESNYKHSNLNKTKGKFSKTFINHEKRIEELSFYSGNELFNYFNKSLLENPQLKAKIQQDRDVGKVNKVISPTKNREEYRKTTIFRRSLIENEKMKNKEEYYKSELDKMNKLIERRKVNEVFFERGRRNNSEIVKNKFRSTIIKTKTNLLMNNIKKYRKEVIDGWDDINKGNIKRNKSVQNRRNKRINKCLKRKNTISCVWELINKKKKGMFLKIINNKVKPKNNTFVKKNLVVNNPIQIRNVLDKSNREKETNQNENQSKRKELNQILYQNNKKIEKNISNIFYLSKYIPDTKSKLENIFLYKEEIYIDISKLTTTNLYSTLEKINPNSIIYDKSKQSLNENEVISNTLYENISIISQEVDIFLEFINFNMRKLQNLKKNLNKNEIINFYKSNYIPNFHIEFNKIFKSCPSSLRSVIIERYIKTFGDPYRTYSTQLKQYSKLKNEFENEKKNKKIESENDVKLKRILSKVDMKKIEIKGKNIKAVGRLKLIKVPSFFKMKKQDEEEIRKENLFSNDFFSILSIPKKRKLKREVRCFESVNQSLDYLRRVQVNNNNEILNLIKDFNNKSLYLDPSLCVLGINHNDL